MKRLDKGREARAKFVESQISQQIAAQIRSMRVSENLSQPKLAEKIGTSQNQIHRLEQARTSKPRISTLKRLAAAFDVALVVRFVPFTQYVAWLSGERYVDTGLSTSALYVASYEKEKAAAVRTQDRKDSVPLQLSVALVSDLLKEIGSAANEGVQKFQPNTPPAKRLGKLIRFPNPSTSDIGEPLKAFASKMQNAPADDAKLAVAGA